MPLLARTESSGNMIYLVDAGDNLADDTGRIALTTDPDLCVAIGQHQSMLKRFKTGRQSNRHNFDNIAEMEKLDGILRTIYDDPCFHEKYNYSSLFLIGSGSYGYVFRVVSNASGPLENPIYGEKYIRLLQGLRETKSRKRVALIDSYRDSLCLDLVAMKIEALTLDDIQLRSASKVHLIKEFAMLTEIFRNSGISNAMVGFPLPIEFGFLAGPRASNLKKIAVFDKYGGLSNYSDAFLDQQTILNLGVNDVTSISYMTMELVGPNLDEWKEFFAPNYAEMGRMVFTVHTTLKLMDQVLCRLLIMHRNNIVHLDLKPDNLCMGIGKMTNTVYLLDYGLSRVCSDAKPTITFGSRRYMSVGVLDMLPANYMMDIESWFYVLIHLLTDYVPWSDDEITTTAAAMAENGCLLTASCEEKMMMMAKLKRKFWGDNGNCDRRLFQQVIDKAVIHHSANVPDISQILTDIFVHVSKMRREFYRVSNLKMHMDIKNDDSDLFNRYHTLRKLLLFAYNIDFAKGGCFTNDKDLIRKQEKRRSQFPMLTYTLNSKNWLWDWDVWFEHDYIDEQYSCRSSFISHKSYCLDVNENAPVTLISDVDADEDSDDDHNANNPEEVVKESIGIPEWMRHYLARVLGAQGATEEVSCDLNSQGSSSEAKRILVAG